MLTSTADARFICRFIVKFGLHSNYYIFLPSLPIYTLFSLTENIIFTSRFLICPQSVVSSLCAGFSPSATGRSATHSARPRLGSNTPIINPLMCRLPPRPVPRCAAGNSDNFQCKWKTKLMVGKCQPLMSPSIAAPVICLRHGLSSVSDSDFTFI